MPLGRSGVGIEEARVLVGRVGVGNGDRSVVGRSDVDGDGSGPAGQGGRADGGDGVTTIVGIAPVGDASAYLDGVQRTVIQDLGIDSPAQRDLPGGEPSGPPTDQDFLSGAIVATTTLSSGLVRVTSSMVPLSTVNEIGSTGDRSVEFSAGVAAIDATGGWGVGDALEEEDSDDD